MPFRVVGAGLPRTGTSSLAVALDRLLGGECLHMSGIPGHPFDLGPPWASALDGRPVGWRAALALACPHGRDLTRLLERFTGSADWDDPVLLMRSYARHVADVRRSMARTRLLEWDASRGWRPICAALGVAVPAEPFPHTNRREDWSS